MRRYACTLQYVHGAVTSPDRYRAAEAAAGNQGSSHSLTTFHAHTLARCRSLSPSAVTPHAGSDHRLEEAVSTVRPATLAHPSNHRTVGSPLLPPCALVHDVSSSHLLSTTHLHITRYSASLCPPPFRPGLVERGAEKLSDDIYLFLVGPIPSLTALWSSTIRRVRESGYRGIQIIFGSLRTTVEGEALSPPTALARESTTSESLVPLRGHGRMGMEIPSNAVGRSVNCPSQRKDILGLRPG